MKEDFNFDIKVLVVDDFMSMRNIVKGIVRQLGFKHIDDADDGVNALKKLKKEKFGLVLSDWNMPNMEGIDLLRKVRADADLKDTPFLLITAEAEKDKIVEAINSGVDNYLIKPFSAEVLSAKLEQVAVKRPSLKAK